MSELKAVNETRDKNGLTEEEFLKGYDADKYPKPALTADICVIAQSGAGKEILLIKRGNHPFLGCWALPGGFADKNEPLEETARRELEEETSIKGLSMQLVGVYSRPGRDPRGWTVSAAYKAAVDKAQVNARAGDDAADAKWFEINKDADEITLVNADVILPVTAGAKGTAALAFDHMEIIADALG